MSNKYILELLEHAKASVKNNPAEAEFVIEVVMKALADSMDGEPATFLIV